MKRVFGVMIVLLLAVSLLAACGPGTPAEFTLSGVTVSPSAPVVNDTVTISATVKNVGEQSGGCDVGLTIGDYTDSKSVSALAGGASSSVSFSYDATTVGSYTATLSTPDATATKSFTVKEDGVDGNGNGDGDGAVPTWSVGDTWTWDCSYENPGGRCISDSGVLEVTMVGEETVEGVACYHLAGAFVPPARRDAATLPLTLTLGDIEVWHSQDYMDYVKMSSQIVELPGLPSTVTWAYPGDYGWPYEVGKTWSYTTHVVAGTLDEIYDKVSEVVAVETVTVPAGTFECYHVVVYEPANPDIYTNEYWFNADVRNSVKVLDRDLWKGEETRELSSYSVS